MNRAKASINNRLKKKMDKEVHRTRKLAPNREEDLLTEKELRKKFPRKALPLQKIGLKAPTALKHHKKTSKRTQPGMVSNTSPPAHIHYEGAVWIKTLTKQGAAQRKVFMHHAVKKK